MAVTKLLLLIVGVVAQEYGATPPNVRPPTEQLREQHGAEIIVHRVLILTRALVCSWALLEASVLFALSGPCPPALSRSLLHALYLLRPTTSLAALTALTTPTPAFIAGTLLALAGAALRAHCYHTLGHLFTFELAIRPSHELVTHGAYAAVRHPSYMGVLGLAVGWLLCVLDPRGVVVRVFVGVIWGPGNDIDQAPAVTALLACAWLTGLVVLFSGMRERMDREDAMLERNFGEEWRAWAKRVPYRLVPGVY